MLPFGYYWTRGASSLRHAVQDVCQPGGTLCQRWTKPRRGIPSAWPADGVSHFVVQGFERMDALLLAARLILAAVFVVSGVSKLFDLSGSQGAMRSFGIPERFTRAGGIALPIAEIIIAMLLIPATTAALGALLALILLAVFVAGISYSLSRGRKFDCHCFGQ